MDTKPLVLQGWVFRKGMKRQIPAVFVITAASATWDTAVLWHGLTPTHYAQSGKNGLVHETNNLLGNNSWTATILSAAVESISTENSAPSFCTANVRFLIKAPF